MTCLTITYNEREAGSQGRGAHRGRVRRRSGDFETWAAAARQQQPGFHINMNLQIRTVLDTKPTSAELTSSRKHLAKRPFEERNTQCSNPTL